MHTNEGFHRIQRHETELVLGYARLKTETDCDSAQQVAEGAVCSPAHELCEVSEQLADPDAQARCHAARDTCKAARERARDTCATQPTR